MHQIDKYGTVEFVGGTSEEMVDNTRPASKDADDKPFSKVLKPTKDCETLIEKFTNNVNLLKEVILNLDEKTGGIMIDWIRRWANFLKSERTFNCKYLKIYKRREIIRVDFGVRNRNEEGGIHYAVVMDVNNNPNSPVLMVVPLTSLKDGKKAHPLEVEIPAGVIIDIDSTGKNIANNHPCAAIVNQTTCISKQVIMRPCKNRDPVLGMVSHETMAEIERKYAQQYLKSIAGYIPKQ